MSADENSARARRFAAMPDIHNAVEDVIAGGDKVCVRWTGSGTHTGASLMGTPAGGRQVSANGIYIFHFAEGKIAEIWNLWDAVNVLL
jgi:predicted ester cyclase